MPLKLASILYSIFDKNVLEVLKDYRIDAITVMNQNGVVEQEILV